jgi:hypothetical protein
MDFKIITCPDWNAMKPRNGLASIEWTSGPASRIIFHHTAGHHREISLPSNESKIEAILYARAIQIFHMRKPPAGRGWNDSGHNFLVCRNGYIFQGRWKTVSAIQDKKMVVSAHCPGQNTQIGIEHEHQGTEPMTKIQMEASAWLQAWIAEKYDRRTVLPVEPHSKYYETSCPANLKSNIAAIKKMAQQVLNTGL